MKKLTLLLFTTILFLVNSGTALASTEVSITVKNPNPYTGNQSWFVYETEAGETIEDVATVKNFGSQAATVSIYAVDASTTTSGTFTLKMKNEPQLNIGDWTNLQIKELILKPGERVDIPFGISIPEGATPSQYFGGIVVESSSTASKIPPEDCPGNNICGTSVAVKTRVGARIYLTVPGAIKEDVSWNSFSQVKSLSGRTYFTFEIENNGNVSYEPRAEITVYDTMGGIYDKFSAPLGISLPGTTIEPKIAWSKETPLMGKFTAEAHVSFPKRFHTKSIPLRGTAIQPKSISFWIIPWGMITAFIIILFSGVGSFCVSLYRRKKLLETCEKYVIKGNENIISIANTRNIDWKLLAKINKLKPPFVVRKGDSIWAPKKDEE